MHIVDLALIPDIAISLLLDWTDDRSFIDKQHRQQRLDHLGQLYRSWAGNDSDRVNPKLFSTDVLKPGASSFAAVSQHYISAAAAKGLLIWLSMIAGQFADRDPTEQNL